MRSQNQGSQRDLVEELIGKEAENDYTHKPDGSYEILNDIVVDRGPNPSTLPSLEPQLSPVCMLTSHSNVRHRDFRRRRPLHNGTSRRRLRRHSYRLHSVQPCRRRLPLPSRKPRHSSHRHMRAHTVLSAYYSARYDRSESRRAL